MNDPVTAAIVEAAIHVPEELLIAGAAAIEAQPAGQLPRGLRS